MYWDDRLAGESRKKEESRTFRAEKKKRPRSLILDDIRGGNPTTWMDSGQGGSVGPKTRLSNVKKEPTVKPQLRQKASKGAPPQRGGGASVKNEGKACRKKNGRSACRRVTKKHY